MESMFSRKLKALGYAQPDTFNIQDERQIRNLIVWLEDLKIRLYKMDVRRGLRDITSPQWVTSLKSYLKDLQCPVENISNKAAVVNWLISYAVKLVFAEKQNQTSGDLSGLENVANLLNVPTYKDKVVLLQAVQHVIQDKFSESAIKEAAKIKQTNGSFLLNDIPLGFTTENKDVDEVAKILRLLQINNLRELHTGINEAIVAAQKLSANPKTDHSLGQVGR